MKRGLIITLGILAGIFFLPFYLLLMVTPAIRDILQLIGGVIILPEFIGGFFVSGGLTYLGFLGYRKLYRYIRNKSKEWVCDKCGKEYYTEKEANKCEKTCQKKEVKKK